MRTNKTGGFTLIELLIVIAIIGILAAVLIPNLMNARTTAAQRAAQSYSANVYTSAVAALSENVRWLPESIGPADCEVTETTVVTGGPTSAGGVPSNYSINPTPAGVETCEIEVNEDTGELEVTVVWGTGDNERTYINGVDVTEED